MHCRHCTTGKRETQDHLEVCTFFRKYRETLDLTIRDHKLIFWRRVTRILNDLNIANKDMFDNNFGGIESEYINDTTRSETCPSGRVPVTSVSDRETCIRGCEGPRIYAGVAMSTRDMSVSEVISDHPP